MEINTRTAAAFAEAIPSWLLRLVHWMHFQKAVVITLNYDTLLESAIAEIPGAKCHPRSLIPFLFASDGSMGGDWRANSLELLKLHGSVNWRYSGRASYAGELIHWSRVGSWGSPIGIAVLAEKSDDTVPLIVPPVADKGSYFAHHSVQHLWRRASQALVAAKRVFCIGYSLPETDLTMRFLLSDLDRPNPVDFYLVNRPSSVAHYIKLLPKARFRLNTCFVNTDPVEGFVDALFTGDFFPDYSGPAPQDAGTVEKAIRDRVNVGKRIPAALSDKYLTVDNFTPISVTLRLDDAEILVRLPWLALEATLVEALKASRSRVPILELDRPLRPYCDRDLGPWIAGLLEVAGVATTWYDTNRWVVSPAGVNLDEVERSRRTAQAQDTLR